MERESRTLEYKEAVTRTFLKTVSAYANYGTGRIVFGVDDEGNAVGLPHPIEDALRIENMVNDSVDPVPSYSIDLDDRRSLISLTVFEGEDTPYLYNGKAYRRQDASTREVGHLELRRLAIEGQGKSFDSLPSHQDNLTFSLLEEGLKGSLGIKALDDDVRRTLGLVDREGRYTNAAALLADENDFPGTDIAVFGSSANEFLDRQTVGGASLLAQYQAAIDAHERYCVSELVSGTERRRVEKVPAEAFREAVANALVHRAWDVRANITVSIHPDRVEVVSPGGLPQGMSEDDYLSGGVSSPRNPLVATAFFRLGIIEKFGTGIRRIRAAYAESGKAPNFEVRSNSVAVGLPNVEGTPAMSQDEALVLRSLSRNILLPRQSIERETGFGRDKTVRLLNALEAKGLVVREGRGRGIRYRLS